MNSSWGLRGEGPITGLVKGTDARLLDLLGSAGDSVEGSVKVFLLVDGRWSCPVELMTGLVKEEKEEWLGRAAGRYVLVQKRETSCASAEESL